MFQDHWDTFHLCLGQKLIEGKKEFAEAWNFGPNNDDHRTVKTVLSFVKEEWPSIDWRVVEDQQPHEANLLHLDNTKARKRLGWEPVWSFDQGIRSTLEWYRRNAEFGEIISNDQLQFYLDGARDLGLEWGRS